jgi:hypothetical protein
MEFEYTVNFADGFRALLTVWVLPQELPQAAVACEKGLGYLFTPCRKASEGKREGASQEASSEVWIGLWLDGREGLSWGKVVFRYRLSPQRTEGCSWRKQGIH